MPVNVGHEPKENNKIVEHQIEDLNTQKNSEKFLVHQSLNYDTIT